MSSKNAIAAAKAAVASVTRSSDIVMSDEGLKEVTKTILIRDIAILPFVKTLIGNFITLAKDEDKYVFQLDPREVKIWETYYPDKLAETASGIAMIEDGIASINQFIKLITIGQHGFKDTDILRLIDMWMKPDYDKNTTAGKPTWDNVKESIMKLYKTMNEFMLKQKQMVTLFLKETGLSFELLRAEVFIPQVAMLHSFIAFHFYYIIGQKEIALFIMTRMEYHISILRLQKGDIALRPVVLRLNDYLKVIGARMEKDVENRKTNEGAKPVPVNTNAEARAAEANAAKARGNALVAEEEEARKAQELAEQKKREEREEKATRKAAKAEADRIAAAAEKAEANRRTAEERHSAALKVMQTKKSAAAEVAKMSAAFNALPPRPSAREPSPKSLPSSTSPTTSVTSGTPSLSRPSPPIFSNTPRVPTPSLAKTGFTPYSRPAPVTRFWELLDHAYIYQILNDLFRGAQDPNVRFYVKGSAAIHIYKRAHRLSVTNHTSDYDTTLLVNPSLPKKNFYDLRSFMLERIMHRLIWSIDDQRFNAEVITKLGAAGIPFASFIYYDADRREPVYAIQDKIPQEYVSVPDKSAPKFYSDRENHFPYASYAAKPSMGVLNLRILRALENPKNVTVIQLYTKTSPEIKLIEVTIPFYEYDETETQISLADQWKAADRINILDGIPVLSLPALKAEQQKLRTLKDAAEIDRRIADINTLMKPAGGAGSARRTRKLRG